MRFQENGGRPGDERGFIHKTILGGISRVAGVIPLPGAGIVSRITGALAGGPPPVRSGVTVPRTLTARPTQFSAAEKELGKALKFGGSEVRRNGDDCPRGTVPDPQGRGFCVSPRSPFGQRAGAVPQAFGVGEAVMGRYGAALQPGSQIIDRAVCLRGMQLGDDGLCYNKSQISNKQRMWPKGRRPLLTGGDMRAISIASRAGKRLERTSKRLQAIGLMKKPAPRGRAPGKALVVKEAGPGSVTVQ